MSRTKDGVEQFVGKTISSVVMTENENGSPRSQLFLIFSDGTSFEFWVHSEKLTTAGCVDQCDRGEVIGLLQNRPGTNIWSFPSTGDETSGAQAPLWSDDR